MQTKTRPSRGRPQQREDGHLGGAGRALAEGQARNGVGIKTGERVIKRGRQGETAYINQFWTARNRSIGTKHIFVGETRITSKLSPGEAHAQPPGGRTNNDLLAGMIGNWYQHRSQSGHDHGSNIDKNPHLTGCVPPRCESIMPPSDGLPDANFVYFYHPDHLGSTTFVTNKDGELYEHVQYFPFGETWVSENTNSERLPYLFTSKELDEETALYYFGARYYDPRTSVWQSTDPILASLLGGAPNGGVFVPANLALYSYSYQNPVNLRDPDGQWASKRISDAFPVPVIGVLLDLLAELPIFGIFRQEPVHQEAIERTVASKVDQRTLAIMQQQQRVIDEFQEAGDQHKHAMTGEDMSRSKAIKDANDFVRGRLKAAHSAHKRAERLKAQGEHQEARDAMDEFGRLVGDAIHGPQDAASSAHEGFQEWDTGFLGIGALRHGLSEGRYPSGQRRRMLEGATEWMYDAAVSGRVPGEVYDSQTGDLLLPDKYLKE